MALAAGLIATVWAGGYAVRRADGRADRRPRPTSLPKGGRLIGRLERAMILMLVLAGQPDGIGFLIAAKSILRFNELARDQTAAPANTSSSARWRASPGPRRRLRRPSAALAALAPLRRRGSALP